MRELYVSRISYYVCLIFFFPSERRHTNPSTVSWAREGVKRTANKRANKFNQGLGNRLLFREEKIEAENILMGVGIITIG